MWRRTAVCCQKSFVLFHILLFYLSKVFGAYSNEILKTHKALILHLSSLSTVMKNQLDLSKGCLQKKIEKYGMKNNRLDKFIFELKYTACSRRDLHNHWFTLWWIKYKLEILPSLEAVRIQISHNPIQIDNISQESVIFYDHRHSNLVPDASIYFFFRAHAYSVLFFLSFNLSSVLLF